MFLIIDQLDTVLKHVPISTNQTIFQQCLQYLHVDTIGDMQNVELRELQSENNALFHQLLRVLALYNITFRGLHKRLNIDVSEQTTLHSQDETLLADIIQNEHALTVLTNLGFTTRASLNGVNRQKLAAYLTRYISDVSWEQEVIQKLDVIEHELITEKPIKLQNVQFVIPSNKLNRKIDIKDTSIQIIKQYFEEDQIALLANVPEDLDSYFDRKKGVGAGRKKKLRQWFETLVGEEQAVALEESFVPKTFEDGQLLMDNQLYEIPKAYLDSEIDYDYFAPVVASCLKDQQIIYFKELKGDIVAFLKDKPKLGKKKIEQFKSHLKSFIDIKSSNQVVAQIKQVFTLVLRTESVGECNERELVIFLNRYNNFQGGVKTLEQVGNEQPKPITRERTRQIVKKTAKRLATSFYCFWLELSEFISIMPYFTVSQIEKEFQDTFTKEELHFIGAILTELKGDWSYDDEWQLFHQVSIEERQAVRVAMQSEAEQLFASQLYVTNKNIEQLLSAMQKKYPKVPIHVVWARSIEEHITKGKTNLFYKIVREDMVYKVFCMYFPNGLHLPREAQQLIVRVKEELSGMDLNTSERNITAYIQRTACLWDRGFFVPYGFVERYNPEQFAEVIKAIEQHLHDNDLMEMNVNLIFTRFEEMLQELSIYSAYALYTVLKYLQPSSLYFRKAPYIRLAKYANEEHVTQAQKIESYFLEAGGPVERSVALKYFTETIGLPSYSFEQRISLDCEIVVQFNSTQYVHMEYIDIEKKRLETLVDQLKRETLKFEDPIPVTIIKKALLKRARIDTYQLLFALLKYYYPDTFTYYRYPLLTSNADEQSGQVSLKIQLENYMLEENRILFISQINERFEQRGWSAQNIAHRISTSHSILPIEKGKIYAHMDVLELTEKAIDSVAEAMQTYYIQKYEADGRFFLPLNEDTLFVINQEIELPTLAFQQVWTVDLLRAILKNSGRFFTPFIKEEVLFVCDNKFGLDDAESIIIHILKTLFQGQATIQQLRNWLTDNDFMTNKLFQRILEEDDAGYIHDGIIISIKQ